MRVRTGRSSCAPEEPCNSEGHSLEPVLFVLVCSEHETLCSRLAPVVFVKWHLGVRCALVDTCLIVSVEHDARAARKDKLPYTVCLRRGNDALGACDIDAEHRVPWRALDERSSVDDTCCSALLRLQ